MIPLIKLELLPPPTQYFTFVSYSSMGSTTNPLEKPTFHIKSLQQYSSNGFLNLITRLIVAGQSIFLIGTFYTFSSGLISIQDVQFQNSCALSAFFMARRWLMLLFKFRRFLETIESSISLMSICSTERQSRMLLDIFSFFELRGQSIFFLYLLLRKYWIFTSGAILYFYLSSPYGQFFVLIDSPLSCSSMTFPWFILCGRLNFLLRWLVLILKISGVNSWSSACIILANDSQCSCQLPKLFLSLFALPTKYSSLLDSFSIFLQICSNLSFIRRQFITSGMLWYFELFLMLRDLMRFLQDIGLFGGGIFILLQVVGYFYLYRSLSFYLYRSFYLSLYFYFYRLRGVLSVISTNKFISLQTLLYKIISSIHIQYLSFMPARHSTETDILRVFGEGYRQLIDLPEDLFGPRKPLDLFHSLYLTALYVFLYHLRQIFYLLFVVLYDQRLELSCVDGHVLKNYLQSSAKFQQAKMRLRKFPFIVFQVECFLDQHRVYLKGMVKLMDSGVSEKYCFMQLSRSLVWVLSFLVRSAMNLKAFLIQYLVIYYLVLCNFLNLPSKMVKILSKTGFSPVYCLPSAYSCSSFSLECCTRNSMMSLSQLVGYSTSEVPWCSSLSMKKGGCCSSLSQLNLVEATQQCMDLFGDATSQNYYRFQSSQELKCCPLLPQRIKSSSFTMLLKGQYFQSSSSGCSSSLKSKSSQKASECFLKGLGKGLRYGLGPSCEVKKGEAKKFQEVAFVYFIIYYTNQRSQQNNPKSQQIRGLPQR